MSGRTMPGPHEDRRPRWRSVVFGDWSVDASSPVIRQALRHQLLERSTRGNLAQLFVGVLVAVLVHRWHPGVWEPGSLLSSPCPPSAW